jgi:hypothetical protein
MDDLTLLVLRVVPEVPALKRPDLSPSESPTALDAVSLEVKKFRGTCHIIFRWAFALTFMSSGCCRPFDSATKDEDNAASLWLSEWQGEFNWTEITTWRSVGESRISRAVSLLRDSDSIELTQDEARDLIGESSIANQAHKPYLLRGVGDASNKAPQNVFTRLNGDV